MAMDIAVAMSTATATAAPTAMATPAVSPATTLAAVAATVPTEVVAALHGRDIILRVELRAMAPRGRRLGGEQHLALRNAAILVLPCLG